MIRFNSKYRKTDVPEIMDDLDFKGSEMAELLEDLNSINRVLGGNRVILSGLSRLLKSKGKPEKICMLDIGCGDGKNLRLCAHWLEARGFEYEMTGVDANANIIDIARKKTANERIKYICDDVLTLDTDRFKCDIALFSLILHHFDSSRIQRILNRVGQSVSIGMIISDLERNYFAFWLFRLFGRVFVRTRTAYHDGLISVARGFTRNELMEITKELDGLRVTKLTRKWAFRWQCLIERRHG